MSGVYLLYQKIMVGEISVFINVGTDVCHYFQWGGGLAGFLEQTFQSTGTKIQYIKSPLSTQLTTPSSFQMNWTTGSDFLFP